VVKNANGVEYATPYAVVCSKGIVCLSEEEYKLQMNSYNDGWFCPKCHESASWDDSCPTTNPYEGDQVNEDYYGYEDGAFILMEIKD
jgi:hypothetical protein